MCRELTLSVCLANATANRAEMDGSAEERVGGFGRAAEEAR